MLGEEPFTTEEVYHFLSLEPYNKSLQEIARATDYQILYAGLGATRSEDAGVDPGRTKEQDEGRGRERDGGGGIEGIVLDNVAK